MKLAVLALCFFSWSHESLKAECDLIGEGATHSTVHAFYFGGKPDLPILDEYGEVSPASCNPHFTFEFARFNKKKIETLLPQLRKLIPNSNSSHVAIYLPTQMYKDKKFVIKLGEQLPRCRIYCETDQIGL